MKTVSDQKKIDIVNIALLASFGFMTLLKVVLSLVPGAAELFSNYVLNIIVSQSITVFPFVAAFVYCGTNIPKEFRIKKMAKGNYALCILFALLVQPVLRFINALSLCFTGNETSDMILDISESIPFAAALCLTAILPAIVEETIFRGSVYRTYKKANPARAVLLSAFLFGLMHGNLNQFLYAFAMGIIGCLLIEASGSVISSMIVHFISNALSVSAIYALPKLYEYLKTAVGVYEEMGMTDVAEYIEYNYGDLTLSGQEWLQQMIKSADEVEITLGFVFMNYLPSAIVFGFLASLILKAIAKNGGNWSIFSASYLGADSVPVEKETKGPYDTEMTTSLDENEGDGSLKILTIPLMITIAMGVLMMFIYETLKLLPQLK